jgi:hypothetical protein
LAAKRRQREIEPYCFHRLRKAKRFHPEFYVFGIEEAVKVKGLKIEVPERQNGGVDSSRGAVPVAIHKELLSPRCGTANLRKVVQ